MRKETTAQKNKWKAHHELVESQQKSKCARGISGVNTIELCQSECDCTGRRCFMTFDTYQN